ncbi:MAG: GDP-mannose 4,6-dehydratase, partial [Oscillospiraceae bacterium]
NGIPNNLMPIVLDKAAGKRDVLSVAGNDYPTPDGSCVRDYIHVVDLAKGHVAAVKKARSMNGGCPAYNLGTGKGYSVFEILDTFQRVNGIDLGYTVGERRAGDAAVTYSDPSLAQRELGWKAELGIEDMCRDAWNFRCRREAEAKANT